MTIRPLRDVLHAPPSDRARAVDELLAHLWGTEGELWNLPAQRGFACLCERVVVRCLRAAMQDPDPDAALLAILDRRLGPARVREKKARLWQRQDRLDRREALAHVASGEAAAQRRFAKRRFAHRTAPRQTSP